MKKATDAMTVPGVRLVWSWCAVPDAPAEWLAFVTEDADAGAACSPRGGIASRERIEIIISHFLLAAVRAPGRPLPDKYLKVLFFFGVRPSRE